MNTADFLQTLEAAAHRNQTEMPLHYSGPIIYQKDAKFEQVSVQNAASYTVLGTDGRRTHLVNRQISGYAFSTDELNSGVKYVVPLLRLSLRSTPFGTLMQAHHLRIRESESRDSVAANWYGMYVEKFGGVVSDREHLEGGKLLWKSFIKRAATDKSVIVYLGNWEAGEALVVMVVLDCSCV